MLFVYGFLAGMLFAAALKYYSELQRKRHGGEFMESEDTGEEDDVPRWKDWLKVTANDEEKQ